MRPNRRRPRADRQGSRAVAAVLVLLATTVGVVGPGRDVDYASALSVDAMSLGIATQQLQEILIGEQPTYVLTAANPTPAGTRNLFNATLRLVLPAGSSLVSASETVAAEIADEPNPGETTVIFDNVADLPLGSSFNVFVTVDTNPDFGGPGIGDATLPVGAALTINASVYANADPLVLVDWDPSTGLVTEDPTGVDTDNSYTGTAATVISNELFAFRVNDTPLRELLRGVHDNGSGGRSGSSGQIVTRTIENNPDYASTVTTFTDVLSPHWEFLGCTTYYPSSSDNSTDVPFNGAAPLGEEWTGSGPVADGPSSGPGCQTPLSVDSPDAGNGDGTANTVVVWDAASLGSAAAMSPGDTVDVSYRAGIPMRQNSITWTNEPGVGVTLNQGRNLDNNAGPPTFEDGFSDNGPDDVVSVGESIAIATVTLVGTYAGVASGGLDPYVETYSTEVEDLIITKAVSGPLLHGSTVTSTLTLSTGEYRNFQNLQVRDLNPDGLCAQGTFLTDLTAEPSPDWQAGCVGGTDSTVAAVSTPYTSVRELADGRTELIWNSADHVALQSVPSDSEVVLAYVSTVRPAYREALADSTPVLAGDEATNWVEVIGPDFTIAETDPALDTEADGTDDADTASAAIVNSLPSIDKRIAERSGPLGDGASLNAMSCATSYDSISWVDGDVDPGVVGYGPGDYVCFEVSADFPGSLDYDQTLVTDILPPGFAYVTGSATRVDSFVSPAHPDPDTLAGTAVTEAAQVVEFRLGAAGVVGDLGHQFRWVLAATLQDPDDAAAADISVNLQKLWHSNTSGSVLQYRDEAKAEWTEPQLNLTKGVATIASVSPAITKAVDQGPDADGSHSGPMAPTPVQADAVVEFRLDLWNDGNADAVDVEVWDMLPGGFTCSDVSGISAAGACTGDGSLANPYRVTWPSTGITVSADLGRTAPTGGNPGDVILRYSLTVFGDVSADESFTNTAGIRKYEAIINGFDDGDVLTEDARRVYVPANNIDTTDSALVANTGGADDQALLTTADVVVAKDQQSGIADGGNSRNASLLAANDEVSVGEVVQYELVLTIPEGTSVEAGILADVLPPELTYYEGSALVDGSVVVVGAQSSSTPGGAFTAWTVSTPSVGSNGTVSVVQPVGTYSNPAGSGDDELTLTFWVVVEDQPAVVDGSSISNTTSFGWDDGLGGAQTPETADAIVLDVVEPAPTVSKSHTVPAGNNVVPGDTITWNIAVSNAPANATAYDVVVTDTLPLGVTVTNFGGGLSDSGSPETLRWTSAEVVGLSAISPGGVVDLTVSVTVDDPSVVSGELRNDVAIQADGLPDTDPLGPGRSYANSAFDSVDLPNPSLVKDIEPFGGGDLASANVGEVIQFSHTVTIPDGTIAYDLTIFDDPSSRLSFDSFGNGLLGGDPIIGAECRERASGSTNPLLISEIETFQGVGGVPSRLAWFVGDVQAVGGDCEIEVPYTMHVDLDAVAGDGVANTAIIRWNGTDEVAPAAPGSLPATHDDPTDPAWDEASAEESESLVVIEPQLTIDKDVAFVGGSPLANPLCDTIPGNLADPDGNPTDGCDSDVEALLRYTITVENTGTAAAIDVTFTDVLDINLTLLDAPSGSPVVADGPVTGSTASVMAWTNSTRTLDASIALLNPGATATFDYDVVLLAGDAVTGLDDYTNTAAIDLYYGLPSPERSLNADVPTYGNGVGAFRGAVADDVVTVEVHTPELTVTKQPAADEDGSDVRLDQTFTWELTIENNDVTAPAFDVDIADTLPPGWVYVPLSTTITTPYGAASAVGAEPNCTADFGACGDGSALNVETLTWDNLVDGGAEPFGDAIDQTHVITISFDAVPSSQVLATVGSTGATVHQNLVAVTGIDSSGSSGDLDGPYLASDTADVFVRRADLRLAKQIEELGPYYFGQDVTYVITVTNDGPDAATGITVDDSLPVEVDLNSVLAGSDGTYSGGTWTIGPLANGASATLRLDVEVRAIGTVTNVASLDTADQWDPDSTPGDASVPGGDDDVDDASLLALAGQVGDRVWYDVDGDAIQDPGEPGIPGVDVTVAFDLGGGAQSATATTDANGDWFVSGMPVDHPITISIVGATLPDGLVITADPDATNDGVNVISLTDDTPVLDRDFGYTGINSLGDEVWFDVDGDGGSSPAAGDVALVGVDIVVTWAGFDDVFGNGDDIVLPIVTTDGSGLWTVTRLMDGDYRVTVQTGSLRHDIDVATYDVDGTGSANVADVIGLGTSSIPAVNDTDIDFAYTAVVGSIGDLVWLDNDGDGTSSGEVGLGGLTMNLAWQNPDGPVVVYQMTTGPDGTYLFSNLPTGDYVVAVDDTTLPGSVAPTVDGDDPVGGGGPNTFHSSDVTLTTPSAVRLDQDFGYQGGNSIGDRVWIDIDGDNDSLFDGVDIGVGGVTVTVDWAPAIGDPEQRSTTTDVNGFYFFSALPDGDFTITVDPMTLPSGLTAQFDSDGVATPNVSALTLAGASNLDQDFAYVGAGSLGDLVWYDYNSDGVLDAGEPGLSGVQVDITWAGVDGAIDDDPSTVGIDETLDNKVISIVTDASGNYTVSNLALASGPDANYRVAVSPGTLPAGMIQTHDADDQAGIVPGASTNDSSDVLLDTGSPNRLDQDFGYTGAGSVGDLVWLDLDASGTASPDLAAGALPNEPGIAGVGLSVVWTNPQGADLVRVVTTDVDGLWSVGQLPHGTVTVTVSGPPSSLIQTFGKDGAILVTSVALDQVAASTTDIDYSFAGDATLGDRVWFDSDASAEAEPADGVLVGDDQPLSGVDLGISWAGFDAVAGDDPGTPGIDEGADDLGFVVTTAADGTWSLANLAPGEYSIDIDDASLPSGISKFTWDNDGAVSPDGQMTATLAAAQNLSSMDVSITGAGSIGDVVWLDLDRDGVQGSGPDSDDEVGLAGVDIEITFGGPTGPIAVTTTTDTDGLWSVENLPFDVAITVTVDDTDLPTNIAPAHDLDDLAGGGPVATAHSAVVTLSSVAPNRDDVDFGYVGLGAIGDTVWLDVDGDGSTAPTVADVGLPSVDVTVTWLNPTGGGANLVVTRTTNDSGTYLAEGLPDGDYVVVVVPTSLPGGVAPSYDNDGAAGPDVADGTSLVTLLDEAITTTVNEAIDLDQDFAFVGLATVGDFVWFDSDGDGMADTDPALAEPIETGAPNIELELDYTDPVTGLTMVLTQTTDVDGSYLFANVPAGNITLGLNLPSDPVGLINTNDRDGNPDGTTDIALGVGVGVDDADFGIRFVADVGISKTSPGEFRVGEQNAWTITVTNSGPGVANDVVVTDTLPPGTTYVAIAGADSVDWVCVPRSALDANTIDCTFASAEMANGVVSTFDLVVDVGLAAVPQVINTATIETSTVDADPSNDTAVDEVAVPLSIIEMSKELTGDLFAGSEANYLLSVRNAGPSITRGQLRVVDELPTGLEFVSASSEGWVCADEGSDVVCTTDNPIPVSATALISVTVRVAGSPGDNVQNSVVVTGGNKVGGVELDPTELPGLIESIGAELAAQIGVDLNGGTVPTNTDGANGNVLARTGMSVGQLVLAALLASMAGALLAVLSRRDLWWMLKHRF